MRGCRPRFPIPSLTLALAVVLLTAPVLADASGTPPAPVLQGPSSVSTSQPFQLSFYYPKGQINRARLQFFYCQTGSNVSPSNDSNTEPFPIKGCEILPDRHISLSPDAGKETLDIKNGLFTTYKYEHPTATNAQMMKWYQGNWYVRARLVSLSGTYGSYGKWHRTLVGSPFVGKPIGLGGAIAAPGISPAIVMKGLKPPKFTTPKNGQFFFGGPQSIDAAGTLPPHGHYAKWACCDMQWQRAVIATEQNNAYVKAHTPPGGVPEIAFPTPRSDWHPPFGTELDGYSPTIENGPTFHGGWSFASLSPHTHQFGYRYWIRIRERYQPANKIYYGPWSAWRSFTVQEHFATTTVNFGGVHAVPGAHPGSPSSSGPNNTNAQPAQSAPKVRVAPIRRLSLPAERTLNR